MLKSIFINATDLSDAWFQSLYKIVEVGNIFTIDEGSFEGQKRLEFDHITVQITHPSTIPLLPKINPLLGIPNPVDENYLDEYLPYLMTAAISEGEAYTYGQRLCDIDTDVKKSKFVKQDFLNNKDQDFFHNQIETMIWTYKNRGYRNNQMILQVGQPSDMLLIDPPCLRHIDTRIQDGKLHFFPYFRSWDLYGGFPANLAAIELMKQYCAWQIGVENGEIIASSKGLHIYSYVFEIVEAIRGKEIENLRG